MPKTEKNKILLFSFIFFLVLQIGLLYFSPVFALEVNYPKLPGSTPPQDFVNSAPKEEIPSLYIEYFINLLIWVSGITAFFILIISGVRYLTSAGNPEAMTSAREYISGAFFGILILFSSYLVFKSINPQILTSELPVLTPPPEIKRADIPAPPIEDYYSLINFEIPFGLIIEKKIFETQAPKGELRSPRMQRIEDIANNILDAANALEIQNGALKLLVDQCRCRVANINCPSLCDANPAPMPCSCDTCGGQELFYVRAGIILLQGENKKQIEKLISEQVKAEDEIHLLKEEIIRLEKAENLMSSCPIGSLDSLTNFANKKDSFTAQKFNLVNFRYWNDIVLDLKKDWATFYCPTGGSIWEASTSTSISIDSTKSLESIDLFGLFGEIPTSGSPVSGKTMACSKTIPVGEIIDRAKRIGNKLVERLEKLVSLNREMTETVDNMHRAVSQCTSQEPKCISVCDPLFCTEVRCFGPVDQLGSLEALKKIIADTQAGCTTECTVKHKFKQDCFEKCFKEGFNKTADEISDFPPCPFDIGKGKYVHELQVEKIGEILNGVKEIDVEGIRDVVKSEPKDLETDREKIGIIPIIDKVMPGLLNDLDSKITEPMRTCITNIPTSSETPTGKQVAFLDCNRAIGTKTENGLLERCCFDETEYKKCSNVCYLKNGNDYKECLLKCLKEESQKTGIRELATCQNKLNFFCCSQ